ncbi:hypothetical protein MKX01_029533 [Papaver californicum]|nr:hypothetical protein MKX01_029533 [Papaver californicum]
MDLGIGNVINLRPRIKRKRSCTTSSAGLRSAPHCSKPPPEEEGNKNKVSWNPNRSNFPLSEEVDPIKRAERSNLMLWTSLKFTLAGAIVVVTLLLIYTLLAPIK